MTTKRPKRQIQNPSAASIAMLDDLGVAYGRRCFTVTAKEFDNDASGGWGPGDYDTLTLDAAVAVRWDAGIRAVLEQGLSGEAAMDLRRHVLAGGEPATWAVAAEVAAAEALAGRAAHDLAERKARLAELLDGLERTAYIARSVLVDDRAWPVVMSNTDGADVRLPGGYGWDTIRRGPEGWLVSDAGGGGGSTAWVAPEMADAMRLAAGVEMGVTPEGAAAGVASPYVGADQRRMYEVVLAAAAAGG